MARVLSPTGIPLVQAQAVPSGRADANAFGAQIGTAMQSAGGNMQSLGMAIGHFQEKRQHAEDQAFLDRADLELDMKYGQIARDEQSKANSGAENMTESVRTRMATETPEILGGLQESAGLRPSAEAIKKADHLAARRQHQHLTHAAVYENNERVRHLGQQLDGTLAMIATSGAQTGNMDDAMTRAEQSITAYQGIMPPAALDKMRQRAAQHFVEQMSANTDPEIMQSLMQRLTRGEPKPDGQGQSAAPGVALPPEAAAAVDGAAKDAGVDPGLLRTIVALESSGNPRASVPSGKYQGLFQLSEGEFSKYGGGDRLNARDNAAAGAKKIRAEIDDFKERYGREPAASDIYLRHQQGAGGYDALTQNPDLPAWQALEQGTAEWRDNPEGAKRAISGNLPKEMRARAEDMTAKEFGAFWGRRVSEHGGQQAAAVVPRGQEAPDGAFEADGLNIQKRFDRSAPYGQQASSAAVPFKGIVVHSTGNDTSSAQDQVAYGQHRDAARGGAFGYHFYIDKDGAIIQGAPMDKRTNHVMPMGSPERAGAGVALDNASAVGISFIGSEGHENPAQIEAFRKLAGSLGQTYGFDPHASTFGHGEIQGNKNDREGVLAVAALRNGQQGLQYGDNPIMAEPTLRGALARELSDKGPAIAKAVEKKREAQLQQEHARRIMAGEMPVDPKNKDDKSVIDNAVASTDIADRLAKADPTAAAQLTAIVTSTGYVPEDAMSRLRAISTNGTAEEQQFAYETAANLLRVKPGALEETAKGKGLREDAESYQAMTLHQNMPPKEAVIRIAEMKTPEFQARQEAFKKQSAEAMKKLTTADITAKFSDWWRLTSPAIGGSDREGLMIASSYRQSFADNYARSGNEEIAKTAAFAAVTRDFGVSSITGNRRVMRYAPETHYPPIEPKSGATPDHSYFSRQLGEAVKQVAGKEIPMSDIYLETIAQTATDVRAGRPPSYGVVYVTKDANGPQLHAVPGAFYADTKMEIERARYDRGQAQIAARNSAIKWDPLVRGAATLAKGVIFGNPAIQALKDGSGTISPDVIPSAPKVQEIIPPQSKPANEQRRRQLKIEVR